MAVFDAKPALPPPVATTGAWGWIRRNLLSSPLDIALTATGLLLLAVAIGPFLRWAVFEASFGGTTAEACSTAKGACWTFVRARFDFFIYGFYPAAERWRVDVVFALLATFIAALLWNRVPGRRWVALASVTVYPLLAFWLLLGGGGGLALVETSKWGGLMLTLVLAVVGMVAALPVGILLALGRRSKMIVIRIACTTFIELWRGVPLISVLFMASVMLPLFLPQEVSIDKLLRALIGLIMFQAAYMAEVVRGGLQAIPRGQFEAAQALGLGFWRSMALIILPQALKLVIPGIVNTFIALFKDTTLVLIIGLLDVLGAVQAALVDPSWDRVAVEGYVFAGFCYWIFCFGISRYSQSLERKLQTGHKR
ncbi:amino acid ABC transporter permease [Pararhodospirillum photometricum]|uniref:Amino acid ABC transporter, permease protein,3-TM region, His/Glu/Gln/Arg/opine n=1 Tax=Pararhodospirillum photometricum DSM 122 TaxID=1150469 RepID=H6SR64_PARPM|nr:amino acid ABC transporter permease [Pararhodospirillum photometricum]CCG09786.1 Amino acid ABC transporter, permease protein,3-TM region, His/Glu/Gln/Arg/opine [Pararhodospirillum photometricum DSM 122]